MKTYKHLYEQITSFENLRIAFKKAAKGKRSKNDVAGFEFNLEASLLDLQDDLQAETYQPGPYFNFHIYDPKPRLISAAPFRDRDLPSVLCGAVHHAKEIIFG